MVTKTPDTVVETTTQVRQDIGALRWSKKNRRPYKQDLKRLVGSMILDILLREVYQVPEERWRYAKVRDVVLSDERESGGELMGRLSYSLEPKGSIRRVPFRVKPFGKGLSGRVILLL